MAFFKILALLSIAVLTINLVNGSMWINASPGEAVLHQPDPVGIQRDGLGLFHLFLCRTQVSNRWIPGKLVIHIRTSPRCIVADGSEKSSENFQVLTSDRGTTSWVPLSTSLPTGAIAAGTASSGRTTYVCRALSNIHVGIGAYNPETGFCTFAMYGVIERNSGVEILVENLYGREI